MQARIFGYAIVAFAPWAMAAQVADSGIDHTVPENTTVNLRPSYQRCLDESGSTTPGMLRCSRAEYGFQDKRLDTSYTRLLSTLPQPERDALRNEEQEWVRHKEAYCAPEVGSGQGQEVTSADCLVGETARRATELESRIK